MSMSLETGATGDRGVKRKGPTTDFSDDNGEPKTRGRACTACRAIKVRCDNPNLAYDGPCSRCTRLSLECVYHEKKRGRKPKNDPDEKQQSCIVPAKAPRTSSTQLVADSPEFSSALESRAPRPPHGSPSLTVSSSDTGGSRYRDRGRRPSQDNVKMYTLANIMSDTHPSESAPRPTSFIFGLSPIDRLEDPIQAEFVTESEVDSLFYSYFAHLNSIIGLLDPRLHTAAYVRRRSSVLYTTIIAVSSKFFLPRVHQRCHALSQSLIGRALASDMCNIEYIQALSLSTFYKDADDASSWRKVGLAIRMAYELNLHDFRTEPLATDELEARKQLNRERTWIQLVLYDFTTASQRNKPNMVPDHDLPDVEGWVRDHPQFPCYADAQLAGSFSFLMVYRVVQSTRGSMMSSKPGGFDATVRHLFRMLDGTPKFWATLQDASVGLAPVSKSIMRFYYFSAQLSINELHMLSLVSPSLETAQVALLQCKDSAVLVLQHVIEDMAPSGFIPYTQDGIAFATAYAGVWLYKHLARFEPGTILEISNLFHAVVEACEKQSQQPKDIPSYFARFFSHLARNSEGVKSPIHEMMNADRTQPQASVANALFPDMTFSLTDYQEYVPPELMPPLDGMDAHWVNVINGLDDWWKNYTYLGSLAGRFNLWLFVVVYDMVLQEQADQLRAELASLEREVDLLRNERDVARLLNEYVYVHDQAFSPVSKASEDLDRRFEEFFTEDGVCDAFGVHTTRTGKAEWVRSILSSQGNISGIQMVTSNTLITISPDGSSATARTSAVTTIAAEGQDIRDYHRAAGWYMYRLRKVESGWKIAYLKW